MVCVCGDGDVGWGGDVGRLDREVVWEGGMRR